MSVECIVLTSGEMNKKGNEYELHTVLPTALAVQTVDDALANVLELHLYKKKTINCTMLYNTCIALQAQPNC